jgi:hypothetical protein
MSKLKSIYSFFLISIFLFCQGWSSNIYAGDGQGQGKGQGKGQQVQGDGKSKAKANEHAIKKGGKTNKIKFGNKDKATITKYFSATPFPGTTLPPGIAKNLLRGKPLPPGIAKVFLPSDLVSELPVHPGYEYLLVGKDAVLVDSTTGIVADIISNVLQ